jgi:hypothetical protein
MAIAPIEQSLFRATDPVAAPTAVGSNCTSSVACCPGFSVIGPLTPDTLNPVPVAVTPLSVAAAVPVEVTVTVCVAGVFSVTSPKFTLLVFSVSVGIAASSCSAKVSVAALAVAVSVAVCAVVTAAAVAVNPAVVAPEATVTLAGTVTFALLLARLTANPPLGAAALRVTVHASVAAPVSVPALQLNPLSAAGATPVPFRLIAAEPGDALSVSVTVPVAAPAAVGSNCTVSVACCPGFSVTGVVRPDWLNPAPAIATALMVTAAVPDEVSVTVCCVAVFRFTFPKLKLVVFSVSAGTDACSCSPKVAAMPPSCAVSVTVWVVVTAVIVAVNAAVVAPAATVTEVGTVTAVLLLERLAVIPPLGAVALSDTVQASVPAPVIDVPLHESPFTAVPQPYKLTVDVLPLEELLLIVSAPEAVGPAAVGAKFTFSVTAWPGFIVAGNVAPDTLKPTPDAVAALMVSGPVPIDVSVSCCVPTVPTATLVNEMLVAPTLSVPMLALSCKS